MEDGGFGHQRQKKRSQLQCRELNDKTKPEDSEDIVADAADRARGGREKKEEEEEEEERRKRRPAQRMKAREQPKSADDKSMQQHCMCCCSPSIAREATIETAQVSEWT